MIPIPNLDVGDWADLMDRDSALSKAIEARRAAEQQPAVQQPVESDEPVSRFNNFI